MGSYWQQRKDLNYYRTVLEFGKTYVPAGERILDVGGRDCTYITWFDWFRYKEIVDLQEPQRQINGVVNTCCDFLDFRSDRKFDLVLCLQVLEHLQEPARFSRKLLSVGRQIILSVPYKWPRGVCASHVQDPVDDEKLLRWLGKSPLERALVTDGACIRLVAVYEGNTENLV